MKLNKFISKLIKAYENISITINRKPEITEIVIIANDRMVMVEWSDDEYVVNCYGKYTPNNSQGLIFEEFFSKPKKALNFVNEELG